MAKVIERQVTVTKTPDVSRVISEWVHLFNQWDFPALLGLPSCFNIKHVRFVDQLTIQIYHFPVILFHQLVVYQVQLLQFKNKIERLGGAFQSKIDETVGIVISSQGISNLEIFTLLIRLTFFLWRWNCKRWIKNCKKHRHWIFTLSQKNFWSEIQNRSSDR